MSALTDAIDETTPLPRLSARLQRIADLLEKSGIDPDEVGRIDKVRMGEYQTPVKLRDADGVERIEQITSRADSLVITPTWDLEPEWPVVQQAAPVRVTPTKVKRTTIKGWHKAVVLPDVQIGYRRMLHPDGSTTLDPFHDEAAISVALSVIRDVRPDKVVILGDTEDLPEFGKYEQLPEFAQTTQQTIDRHHRLLVEIKAAAPEAEIHEIEGNHDARLARMVARNAMAALRLRRADEPDGWPVMSIPHMTRMDELGVTYHDGYPAGEVWINDNLVCFHGTKVNSAGSTAARVIEDERVSAIHGHIHRIEMQHKTRRVRAGRRQNFVASPGCLCRTDGAVPSVKGGTDYRGRVVTAWENWQQGLAVVTFEQGDGRFDYEQVSIFDGAAIYRDRIHQAA